MSDRTSVRWWWVRHAPVTEHCGRIYGQLDLPATLSSPQTFTALAHVLPIQGQWVATPLQRTRQTLDAIQAAGKTAGLAFSPDIIVEPRFLEQDFGAWQGLDHATFRREHAAAHRRFWLAPADETPPDGESFADLVERCAEGIEALSTEQQGRDIVCVAHGGSIRAAIGVALGLTPEASLSFVVDNLSLTRLDRFADGPGGRPVWRVVWINRPL